MLCLLQPTANYDLAIIEDYLGGNAKIKISIKKQNGVVVTFGEPLQLLLTESAVLRIQINVFSGPHFRLATANIFIPPANFVCGGYTVFTLSMRASVRPSATFCFLNILKSNCWIFIKPCKHVHIFKTITLDKKVRARGQFY